MAIDSIVRVSDCSTGLDCLDDLKNYLFGENGFWEGLWSGHRHYWDRHYGVNRESAFNFSESAEVQAVRQCPRWSPFFRENKNDFAV